MVRCLGPGSLIWGMSAKILQIVWFNLILIASEGLAVLQTYNVASPLFVTQRVQNVLLVEAVLFVISVGMAIWLFTETLRFLDKDHVDTLAQRRIILGIPDAVENDLLRLQQLTSRLQSEDNGS